MNRPCLGTPNRACTNLTSRSRCPTCERANRQAKWDNQPYRNQRDALLASTNPNTRCSLCGQPARAGDPWQADHRIPASQGGGLGANLQVAHRSCNSSKRDQPA